MSGEFAAVPDPATRMWFVKWHDVTVSLTGEEYTALKVAAINDPPEAMRLFETYRNREMGADR